jgi:hypothetical protein
MMLTAFLSLLAVQSKPITMELRGCRLEAMATELSKEFGEPVYTPPYMKNTAITIRVTNVTAEELRGKIAQVLNAEWLHDKTGWRLSQSATQKRDEEQLSRKLRYEKVLKQLQKARADAGAMEPFDKKTANELVRELDILSKTNVKDDSISANFWQKIQKVQKRGPSARFATRLLTRITPDLIMGVSDENPRVVYSMRPTPMQQPLKIKFQDLFEQLKDEQSMWAETTRGRTFEGPEASSGGTYWLGGIAENTEPIVSQAANLTISVSGRDEYFAATVSVYDAAGKRLIQEDFLNSYEFEADEEGQPRTEDEVKKLENQAPKLSPEAQEFKDRVTFQASGKRRGTISDALAAKLSRPDLYDPTSYVLTERVWQTAGSSNIVAILPAVYSLYDPSVMLRFQLKRMGKLEEKDGWFLLSPQDAYQSRKREIDRTILTNLSRYVKGADRFTLDDEANLALLIPRHTDTYFYKQWIDINLRNMIPGYNDPDALRIWATLPQNLKNLIREGRPAKAEGEELKTKFGGLPRETQYEISTSVFESGNSYDFQLDYESLYNQDPELGGNEKSQDEIIRLAELVNNGIWGEVTFLLQNGVESQLPFEVKVTHSDVLRFSADPNAKYSSGREMTPEQYGWEKFQFENPAKYPWAQQDYMRVDTSSIQFAHQVTVAMKLKAKEKVQRTWQLTNTRVTDAKVYTLETLPDAIRKKIDEAYKQAQEQSKNDNGYSGFYRQGAKKDIPPTR